MPARSRISLLSCVLALAFAGCGSGDGTIPQDESDDLLSLLAATEEAVSAGECDRAQEFAQKFEGAVSDLPSDVDQNVAEELSTAAVNLDTLANNPEQCGTGATGETGSPVETPTEEETTTTEEEEPTTTTTDEETTTTEEEEEEPTTTIEEEPEEPSLEPPAGGEGGGPSPTPGGGVEPPSGGVGAGGGPG